MRGSPVVASRTWPWRTWESCCARAGPGWSSPSRAAARASPTKVRCMMGKSPLRTRHTSEVRTGFATPGSGGPLRGFDADVEKVFARRDKGGPEKSAPRLARRGARTGRSIDASDPPGPSLSAARHEGAVPARPGRGRGPMGAGSGAWRVAVVDLSSLIDGAGPACQTVILVAPSWAAKKRAPAAKRGLGNDRSSVRPRRPSSHWRPGDPWGPG